MPGQKLSPRTASVVVEGRPRGGVSVRLPFDPSDAWGVLDAYHVDGTLGGQRYRGTLVHEGHTWRLELGPSWCRAPGFGPGDEVELVMAPEGPRTTTMGDDVAAAFRSDPDAARFFDSMPSYYRNNAARSVDSAKRPETRARRIDEIVDLARRRERPER
jgi:Bacteriocin-protection, YdeI or OmpD-Associated/Domain of unknown function (DUF1905)